MTGPSGAGKTTLEDEIRVALQEVGAPVAALAQSTGAVDELRSESGFQDAATIARFLTDKKMQASVHGGVILVDEASLVGTRDMVQLFDIARNEEARIVLVGAPRCTTSEPKSWRPVVCSKGHGGCWKGRGCSRQGEESRVPGKNHDQSIGDISGVSSDQACRFLGLPRSSPRRCHGSNDFLYLPSPRLILPV